MKASVLARAATERYPDWGGGDQLTHVLQRGAENASFTVAHHPKAVNRFREAMDLFAEGIVDYEEVRRCGRSDFGFVRYDRALTFFTGARRSLLCGAKLTYEHELTDAAKPLRGAIEAAFAACHVFSDPGAYERWMNRPPASRCSNPREDAARLTRREVGTEFGVPRLAAELRSWSISVASAAFDLYEELIDVGGHFNVATLQFTTIQPDGTELSKALSRVNRTAVTCLRMLDLVFAPVWSDAKLSQQIRRYAGAR